MIIERKITSGPNPPCTTKVIHAVPNGSNHRRRIHAFSVQLERE